MATKKAKKQTIVAMAATPEDLRLFKFFREKLGANNTGVIRYCLRKTAEQDKRVLQSQPA